MEQVIKGHLWVVQKTFGFVFAEVLQGKGNILPQVLLLAQVCLFAQDRNIVLRKFIENGCNADACEASVQLSREEIDKVKKGMIQMTLQDMIDAKFSQNFGCNEYEMVKTCVCCVLHEGQSLGPEKHAV